MAERACLLFSGGADSVMCAVLLRRLGFHVVGIYFSSPFFERKVQDVFKLAEIAGVELKVVELGEDYLEVLKNPVYGYGRNVNPCIDCKAYMLRKVSQMPNCQVIATGDVLGQRPMSQSLSAFLAIERLANLEGKVLRPLSGKLLPPTVYETAGIVDRNKLLDLKGRSRKRYPELLKSLGLSFDSLPTPAGGCLLTNPSFAVRVRDLLEHNDLTLDNAVLLRFGRHFRINSCKLVVGRNRKENELIRKLAKEGDILIKAVGVPSPVALLRCKEEPDEKKLVLCASITARYSDAEKMVKVVFEKNRKHFKELKVKPVESAEELNLYKVALEKEKGA